MRDKQQRTTLNFSKMQGLGNDFMVLDNVTQNVFLSNDQIKRLADRNFGVGFDQLLVVEPPYDPDLDFHYRIFNADGSEVSQCGNGARCFARFVRLKGLTNKNKIRVSTASGKMTLLSSETVMLPLICQYLFLSQVKCHSLLKNRRNIHSSQ